MERTRLVKGILLASHEDNGERNRVVHVTGVTAWMEHWERFARYRSLCPPMPDGAWLLRG